MGRRWRSQWTSVRAVVLAAAVLLVSGAALGGVPVPAVGVLAALSFLAWALVQHDRERRPLRERVQREAWLIRPCRGAHQHALRSPRLTLRAPTKKDAPAFATSLDDVVRRWQGYGEAQVHAWLVNFGWAMGGRPPAGCPLWLGVYDREHGERFAGLYIITLDGDGTSAELGWWLGAESRGRGIGGESLPLVVAYVHEHLGVTTVRMGTSNGNEPALAQIRSAGGVVVGGAAHRLPDGQVVDGLWFEHRAQAAP